MGKPCVAAAQDLEVRRARARCHRVRRPRSLKRGRLDHPRRRQRRGLSRARPTLMRARAVGRLPRGCMEWADKVRHIRVRVNADTPADAHRGPRLRRRGHRALPHRAHVLRGRPAPGDARDDRGPGCRGAEAALAKLLPMQRGDFEAIFRAMEGYPGHHPAARPAAARVPAARRERDRRRWRAELGKTAEARARIVNGLHETNPMLGLRGLPPGDHLPRDHRDAGAGDLRGRVRRRAPEGPGAAGGDDPAGGQRGGVPEAGADRATGGGGGLPRAADHRALPARHHDRAAARGADRGRDRPRGAVLLLRHQRPDPDDLGPLAATTPGGSCPTTSSTASSRTTRSRCSTRPASAS